MVLLVNRSDHEIIWLPDGDEVPDREKHMIQSPKLMQTFVWNPHGFQIVDAMQCNAMQCHAMQCNAMPCHAMPKGEMFRAAYDIRNIRTEIVAWRGERGERRLVVHADNARPHPAKVTRAFCDDNFLRIASHPRDWPDSAPTGFFLFACFLVFLFSCFLVFLFSCFLVWASQNRPKDSNSGLHMHFL
jgi:hypothetical protein